MQNLIESSTKVEFDITDEVATEVLKLYDAGASDAEICRKMQISLSTFKKRREQYPEFDALIELGKTYSMAWWCKKGRDGLENRNFNFMPWIIAMKNRFGYGDKSSEIKQELKGWKEGDILNNLRVLDSELKAGRLCPERYGFFSKALAMQAKLLEIINIIPFIKRQELDGLHSRNEISEHEYKLQIACLEANATSFANQVLTSFNLSGGRSGDKVLLENRETSTARACRTKGNKANMNGKVKPNTFNYKKPFGEPKKA